MKKYIIGSVLCFLVSIAWAQPSQIALLVKSAELKKAKYLIDSICEMQIYEKDAEAWFMNGFVHENIAYSADSATKSLMKNALLVSADAYLKAAKSIKNSRYAAMAQRKLDSAITNNVLAEGVKLENEKKIEDAVSYLDLYISIKPNDTTGLIRNAIANEKALNFESAKKAYTKLLELKHKPKYVYKSIILIYKDNLENPAEASKYLLEAKKLFPNDEDWTKIEIAILIQQKKSVEAIKKLDTAISIYPNSKLIYTYNIGALYHSLDSASKAIEYYEKALAVDEKHFESNYNLGGIYYKKAVTLYSKVNEMVYADYQKQGKKLEEEANGWAGKSLPYFERAYSVRKEEKTKKILRDLYRNLKMNSKFRELEKEK